MLLKKMEEEVYPYLPETVLQSIDKTATKAQNLIRDSCTRWDIIIDGGSARCWAAKRALEGVLALHTEITIATTGKLDSKCGAVARDGGAVPKRRQGDWVFDPRWLRFFKPKEGVESLPLLLEDTRWRTETFDYVVGEKGRVRD